MELERGRLKVLQVSKSRGCSGLSRDKKPKTSFDISKGAMDYFLCGSHQASVELMLSRARLMYNYVLLVLILGDDCTPSHCRSSVWEMYIERHYSRGLPNASRCDRGLKLIIRQFGFLTWISFWSSRIRLRRSSGRKGSQTTLRARLTRSRYPRHPFS